MKRTLLALWSALLGVALFAVAVPLASFAGGGKTIKDAPNIPLGEQTFGNTRDGTYIGVTWYEFWKAPLIVGDLLTIKFEQAPGLKSISVVEIRLPSIDDFNFLTEIPEKFARLGSNLHGQLDYRVAATGSYPVAFRAFGGQAGGGPYDFTASVQHQARLNIVTRQLTHRGVAKVSARFPDGSKVPQGLTVTLLASLKAKWVKLGKAAVSNGQASIPYGLPKSVTGKVKLRAVGAGAEFAPVSVSAALPVR